MKNKILLLALIIFMSVSGQQAYGRTHMTREQQQERALQIQTRVNEIRAMDMSSLSSDQRVALKHELKDMRKELKQMDPVVVVVSTAGLLLIILILILLL